MARRPGGMAGLHSRRNPDYERRQPEAALMSAWPEEEIPDEIDVDLTDDPYIANDEDGTIFDAGAAGVIVDFEPRRAMGGVAGAFDSLEPDFNANLAEHMPESDLAGLAEDLLEKIDWDERSRRPWLDLVKKGLELLGLEKVPEDEIVGSSAAQYPLLSMASVEFNARALGEIFPPAGPVKAVIMGDATPEKEKQRDRVQAHMNYQLTVEDPTYFNETDKLLFQLSWLGSYFRKGYHEHRSGLNVSRIIDPRDLIVPYLATSLEEAPRFTHKIPMTQARVRALTVSGLYRAVALEEPADRASMDEGEENPYDDIDSKEPSIPDGDHEHIVYECYVDLDLPGFEADIELPYIVTIEKQSRQILGIRRNWAESDPLQNKLVHITHYQFMPGPGFYGLGYLQLIGNLASAASDTLRALLDSATAANLQGGFVTKDANFGESGPIRLVHGEWQQVPMTSDEIGKAFYTPPFREPPRALFELLGLLIEGGQRLTSTTEMMIGDGNNMGPVGTTVALIEQGSKVYSAIHQRIHAAAAREFRILAKLNGDYIPAEGYPYEVEGASRSIAQRDYDGRVDVIPVSDPNIFSSTQRIALAQAIVERATAAPDLYNRHAAEVYLFDALRIPHSERFLLDPMTKRRLDPVAENMAILHGQSVHAYPEQNHEAHLVVLMQWWQSLPPDGQKITMPAVQAHAAEHLAWAYYVDMMQAGVQMGMPPDFSVPPGADKAWQEMPPQIEQQVAVMAAQASGQISERMKQLVANAFPEQMQPEDMEAKAEIAREDAKAQAEEARRQQAWENDQKRRDQDNLREAAREVEKTKAQSQEDEVNAEIERERMRHEIELEKMRGETERAKHQLERDTFNAQQRKEAGLPDTEVPNEGEPAPDFRVLMVSMQEQIAQMTQVMAQAQAQHMQAMSEMVRASQAVAQQMATATERFADAAEADRELVTDENGVPQRSRIVPRAAAL